MARVPTDRPRPAATSGTASGERRDRPPRHTVPRPRLAVAEPLRTFLDRYADAYSALDVDALAEMYAMPCLFVGSGQTAAFQSPAALLRHLGFVAEQRRDESIGAAVPTRVQTLADGGAQTVVLVHWIVERAGISPLRFRSLYHLVHGDGQWRIAVSSSLDDF